MFYWKSVDADGNPAPTQVEIEGFETQQRAEEWLSENYEELLDQGVGQVSLLDEDRVVYGPMGLEPA